MPEHQLSDYASHPVHINFRMISTKYSSNQWEVEIQMSAQVFGPKNNNSLCVGRAFVPDARGGLTPLAAFKEAVDQIIKGDKHWRPILCHDQER